MENIENSKAANTDKIPERSFKDGVEFLPKLISEIFNLPISHRIFIS